MEDLIIVIVKSNIGYKVCDHFSGILVYAVDIVLLAPWRQALQLMVDIHVCSLYAGEHKLLFSTNIVPIKSKNKCLICSHSYTIGCTDVIPIVSNGQRLPYVSSDKHLGNTLDSGIENKDLQIKRGITLGKLNSVASPSWRGSGRAAQASRCCLGGFLSVGSPARAAAFFISGYTLNERRGLAFHAPRVRLLQEF